MSPADDYLDIMRAIIRIVRKWFTIFPLYLYTAKRYCKYSATTDTEESMIGSITMGIHGIEKGLTMGDFRAGFGKDRLMTTLANCELYIKMYGTENIQIHHIAKTVHDYKLCHSKLDYKLDDSVLKSIDTFLSHFKDEFGEDIQMSYTREEYFAHNQDDFATFSKSRHSCRNFSDEPVDIDTIDKAIQMAQTAPSACNRQPVRLYVITSRDTIKKVLTLHGGTRGFADKIDKLIMVCGYLPCYHTKERDCVYTDCGIFTMNLAYALHYHKVGNCILNWSVIPKDDKACRGIVPVTDKEAICCLIACGNVPEKFSICESGKKSPSSIIHHIN